MLSDTIAAIATASGEGAIGIVRISGPDALAVAKQLFAGHLVDRRAVFGAMRESNTGRKLDEGIAVLMRRPRSYTGEDTVELHAHGGVRSLRRIFEAVLTAGARAAEPGEFTLRAFLNGRMDLTQAEAVLQVVQARTDETVDAGLAAIDGHLGQSIAATRRLALETLAYLGARADFPDEDVPLRDISSELDALTDAAERLVRDAQYGILQREGVRIAILGRPNVGKSSLMNRLLGSDRAIVTPIAGTTRDTIEESTNIEGLPVVLTDTAGLRETSDAVERIGVERSRATAERSEILLLVVDASTSLDLDDLALLRLLPSLRRIVVLNKMDLTTVVEPDAAAFTGAPAVRVSARTGEGLDALRREIHELATGGAGRPEQGTALSTTRQRDAARRALAQLRRARLGYGAGLPEDLLSVDLAAAVRSLGEITGEDATEDLLDTIFSRFCIGK